MTAERKRRRKLAFCFAPLDVCGLYSSYAYAMRELGHRAEFINLSAPGYASWRQADSATIVRGYVSLYHWCRQAGDGVLGLRARLLQVYGLVLVLYIALRFDVIVLKSGETLTGRRLEPWLYKAFGLRIIAIYHGSDSRPPYLAPNISGMSADALRRRVEDTRARVDRVRGYADLIVDNPLSGHFQQGRVCNYQVIGNAAAPEKFAAAGLVLSDSLRPTQGGAAQGGPPRIVHAPSSMALKGTDRIRAAIDELRAEGYDFVYEEISGRPNAEVLQCLSQADIAVDELYSDIDGAVFALEACCLGVPVIVGGYGRRHLDRHVPAEARLPSYFIHPDGVKQAIAALLDDAALRQEFAQRSIAFASGYGRFDSVAKRLIALAAGTAPAEWFYDAEAIAYVEGVAAPEETIRQTVAGYLAAFGADALMLDDKPRLRQAIIAFAAGTGKDLDYADTPDHAVPASRGRGDGENPQVPEADLSRRPDQHH